MSLPLLYDFPDHFETERLLIRVPRAGDAVIFHTAATESYAELRPWIPWAAKPIQLQDNEAFVRRAAAKFIMREDLVFLMFRKEDGLLVGGIGLHRIDWNVPKFEIGYWLRTSMHGKGYMVEAVNGMTRFTFDMLHAERIEIRCDDRNEKSAAVARRTGYTLEGCLRNDGRDVDGNLRSTLVFSMLRGEYKG
jgi:ribosomal-protein-serine acetyltransferase